MRRQEHVENFSTEGKIYSGMERIYQILLLNSILSSPACLW